MRTRAVAPAAGGADAPRRVLPASPAPPQVNAAYKWGWFGGANTDCGCDHLWAAYFGTGLLLSYLVRRARGWMRPARMPCRGLPARCLQSPQPRHVAHTAAPPQFLFIDFFIQTYKKGVARRRAASKKKTK